MLEVVKLGNKKFLVTEKDAKVGTIITLPNRVGRFSDSWYVTPHTNGAKVLFDDAYHGSAMAALKAAVRWAILFYDNHDQKATEYQSLVMKGRLKDTGEVGVFLRTGLKQYYLVSWGGVTHEFDFTKKDRFIEAVNLRDRLSEQYVTPFDEVMGKLGMI